MQEKQRWSSVLLFALLDLSHPRFDRVAAADITPRISSDTIPHILHHVYLSGHSAFLEDGKAGLVNTSMRQSCLALHPGWEHVFWDQAAAESLVKTEFPEFEEVWGSYDSIVTRGDVIRYMIMWSIGGLYLDVDVQCLQPVDESLGNNHVLLQGSGPEGVTNAVLASRPRETFWKEVLAVCTERSPLMLGHTHIDPLTATGPGAVTEAVAQSLSHQAEHRFIGSGWIGATLEVDQQRVKVFAIGEWFGPCWVAQRICWKRLRRELLRGTLDLEGLYGVHWMAGSWA